MSVKAIQLKKLAVIEQKKIGELEKRFTKRKVIELEKEERIKAQLKAQLEFDDDHKKYEARK